MSFLPNNTTDHLTLAEALRRRLKDDQLSVKRREFRSIFCPPLAYGRHYGPPGSDAKPAAVMILLEPRGDQWSIPLTVRPQTLADHPGQISFPGGRLEPDESHRQAAEREFAEELGVAPFPGEVLGELSPIFVFNSNYFVRPFVAVGRQTLSYKPCPREVERVIHLPLTSLTDPQQREPLHIRRGQVSWSAPSIRHGPDRVWGATAIMLGELAALLDDLSQ